MIITLTTEQQDVLNSVISWSRNSSDREISIGGYAGTGKTTLIRKIVDELKSRFRISICAPSGKAASILRSKGIQASTIHALIYTPYVDADGALQFDRKEKVDARIIIVDEASMVDDKVYQDVLSFGTRVIWVGDHGQLEPIGKNPGLMLKPTLRLETIMRQALESPILALAHRLRNDEPLSPMDTGDAQVLSNLTFPKLIEEIEPDVVIVGTNVTRHLINAATRKYKKRLKVLEVGDRVICLRNNYAVQLFNGQIGTITKVNKIEGNSAWADVEMDDGFEARDIRMNASQFGANALPNDGKIRDDSFCFFDYAYAITCHKAQGSEWNKVVVLEQLSDSWDRRRWSYTAATRAKNKLVYVRKG